MPSASAAASPCTSPTARCSAISATRSAITTGIGWCATSPRLERLPRGLRRRPGGLCRSAAAALSRRARRPTGGNAIVSAYATSHAWEDFAETWAHYLHILDTLETAEAFGVATHPRGVAEADQLSTEVDFAPDKAASIAPLVKAWLPLTFALNSLNRSMGHGRPLPLRADARRSSTSSASCTTSCMAGWACRHPNSPMSRMRPVPENSPPPDSPAIAGVS